MSTPLVGSLVVALQAVPDPRHRKGRRHPLTAILSLTVVATLAGCKSLEAIAQFGRDHGPALAEALGFTRPLTPCKATLSNVFRALDVAAYERALAGWLQARCPDLGDALALGQALESPAQSLRELQEGHYHLGHRAARRGTGGLRGRLHQPDLDRRDDEQG